MAESLPKLIKDHILKQANEDNYEAMPNTYSITTLLYCLRKAYYRTTLPKKPVNLKTAVNFYRGNLWDHAFTTLYKRSQVRSTYRCKNIPITISGRFDFIDEDGVLYDLKSPNSLFFIKKDGQASVHYQKQALFYCYTNAIKTAKVMYWDGNECLIYPVEVTDDLCNKLIEELEDKAAVLWASLQTGKPPAKNVCNPEPWECRYCSYLSECNGETQL